MSAAGSTLDLPTVIFLGAVLLAVLCTVLLLATIASGEGRRTKRRLEHTVARARGNVVVSAEGGDTNIRRATGDSPWASLDKWIKRLVPRPDRLRERLARTGRKIRIGEYAMVSLAVGLVMGGGTYVALDLPVFVNVMAGVVGTFLLPHMAIGRMAARRRANFLNRFPEAIELMVRGLKSGLPITESIKAVASEFGGPVGEEFQYVVDSMRVGRTLEDALWDTAPRVNVSEFKFFIVALGVQRETGGNLAETLENLADVLRRRRQMKAKIKALSAEPKASAMILGSLPFIMGTLIYVVNTPYVKQLFIDPRGHLMVAAGLVWLAIGITVMVKMTKFEI